MTTPVPKTLLVAGAAGNLGRHVVCEAVGRGHLVRTLVHRTPLPEDLAAVVTEQVCADALDQSQLTGVCDGVHTVFSCLGASISPSFAKGRRSYTRVDAPANRNLIDAALAAGVKRFVYVSVACHDRLGHLNYVRAHEQVVSVLAASGLDYSVVRPTGFFSAFAEVLTMAAKGPVPLIGEGSARTNPIHDADVAAVCVDAVEGQECAEDVGGPETLTRREIVELAFDALGKRARMPAMPAAVVPLVALLMRPVNPRMSHLSSFLAAVSTQDVLAPSSGRRTLSAYFAERMRQSVGSG